MQILECGKEGWSVGPSIALPALCLSQTHVSWSCPLTCPPSALLCGHVGVIHDGVTLEGPVS